MTILEPFLLATGALGGLTGAILGVRAEPWWGVDGVLGGVMRGLGGFVGGALALPLISGVMLYVLGLLLTRREARNKPRS
ncbi:hypothetical protein SAMN05443572_104717 [Myxococcus fulvus]|uniref:Uncharacterized protein n=1 Tax=Myxococcus fulvus TaxID=33 RepID=A0A511SXM2_MYXFU|nr:hypothetical protein [Myxococcus fulvus]AKF87244.1 hypothetical protein MFUL124B02_39995 [Myxococcus fulvus 124B02]GEN06649.1 hypothetical protein MFU01_16860 [Myxococcus fulvus]SEU07127.1 hypothetical protein SAMN05443572_104717 [Myxococcus fulvus]